MCWLRHREQCTIHGQGSYCSVQYLHLVFSTQTWYLHSVKAQWPSWPAFLLQVLEMCPQYTGAVEATLGNVGAARGAMAVPQEMGPGRWQCKDHCRQGLDGRQCSLKPSPDPHPCGSQRPSLRACSDAHVTQSATSHSAALHPQNQGGGGREDNCREGR